MLVETSHDPAEDFAMDIESRALNLIPPGGPQPPRLFGRVCLPICARHYSPTTEKAYRDWIKRYIFFHGKRHPAEMGADEVTRFLSSLALHRPASASMKNRTLSAPLIYPQLLNRGPAAVRSPADRLAILQTPATAPPPGHWLAEIDSERLQRIPVRSSAAPATARPLSANGYCKSP
jgi:hypothetical protein